MSPAEEDFGFSAAGTRENKQFRVLLVGGSENDIPQVKDVFSRVRDFLYFNIETAQTLQAARGKVRDKAIDAVLLDISSSLYGGIDAWSWVEEHAPKLPIIILMDENDDKEALGAMQRGAKDYLAKTESNWAVLPQLIVQTVQEHSAVQALKKRDEWFRILIENSEDVITVLESSGSIRYESPSLERIFGYQQDEVIGKNAFDYCHPEDKEHVMEALGRAIDAKGISEVVQFRFKHQNGSWIYLEAIGRAIEDEDGRLLCVVNSRDVTERVRIEKELREMSFIDELTGLFNRRAFIFFVKQKLRRARQSSKENMTLLYVDLDRFKEINDRLGHLEGDKLLIDVGKVLQSAFRGAEARIARIGGDEFVVLLEGAGNMDNEKLITERLIREIKAWNERDEHPHKLSMSIGVARCDFKEALTADELLNKADKAMYDQKRKRKLAQGG